MIILFSSVTKSDPTAWIVKAWRNEELSLYSASGLQFPISGPKIDIYIFVFSRFLCIEAREQISCGSNSRENEVVGFLG